MRTLSGEFLNTSVFLRLGTDKSSQHKILLCAFFSHDKTTAHFLDQTLTQEKKCIFTQLDLIWKNSVEFFTISQQYKNVNVANFVLGVSL